VTINYPEGEYHAKSKAHIFDNAKDLQSFLNEKHPELSSVVVVVLPTGQEEEEQAKARDPELDTARLDWLETRTKSPQRESASIGSRDAQTRVSIRAGRLMGSALYWLSEVQPSRCNRSCDCIR
jgi:hypothetical protein